MKKIISIIIVVLLVSLFLNTESEARIEQYTNGEYTINIEYQYFTDTIKSVYFVYKNKNNEQVKEYAKIRRNQIIFNNGMYQDIKIEDGKKVTIGKNRPLVYKKTIIQH